jgi:UDP-glucose 4-epimerase
MTGVVLRLANVYGPRQRNEGEGAVVAAFSGAVGAGAVPVLHGDGGQSRDFIFVEDVARAFTSQLGVLAQGITVNIATGIPTTILELWRELAALAGRDPSRVEYGPERSGDIRHSLLATARAQEALGFRATTALAEGLAKTYAYFAASLP